MAAKQQKNNNTPGPAASSTYAFMTGLPARPGAITIPTTNQNATRVITESPPSTRPAIVVTTKAPVNNRQEALDAFRKTISFKNSNYAPARITPLSKGKLRVEFDNERDRNDALKKIQSTENAKITADIANRLKPMAIVKGISKEITAEELVLVQLIQNIVIELTEAAFASITADDWLIQCDHIKILKTTMYFENYQLIDV